MTSYFNFLRHSILRAEVREMERGKRRFGVSIPYVLANTLDELASKLGMNRSSLIEKALRDFLQDHIHYLTPHQCQGIMILMGKYERSALLPIIEKYRDIIHSYIHTHLNNMCIEIIMVSGNSTKISSLHSMLERSLKGCRIKYIPIGYELDRRV
ncbi:MAG: CopG family transcriptional regulator [Desulfurococcales archaeon ex4484_42]|nr:MAG: CopG family transcriptional regulator [Desulfurococcales archaeon ex4484_42]